MKMVPIAKRIGMDSRFRLPAMLRIALQAGGNNSHAKRIFLILTTVS